MSLPFPNEGAWQGAQTPGPLYAFVPAHGDSKAGAVQESLGRAWSEGFGLAVLLVDFAPVDFAPNDFTSNGSADPMKVPVIRRERGVDRCTLSAANKSAVRNLVSSAEARYEVICVDLTGAPEPAATMILYHAHSVFLVSDSDTLSLESARAAAARYARLKLEDRLAMLLRRIPGGLRADLAEDFAGVPVCGLVETPEQLCRLARWLAQPQPDLAAAV